MITIQQTGEAWTYRCNACGWSRVFPFGNLVNPKCDCGRVDKRRDLKEPSLLTKAKNFSKAAAKHVAAGRPLATDETVAERFSICQACEIFKPKSEGQGVCTHKSCGCALKAVGLTGRNKLRWADSVCPLDKWQPLPPAPPAE